MLLKQTKARWTYIHKHVCMCVSHLHTPPHQHVRTWHTRTHARRHAELLPAPSTQHPGERGAPHAPRAPSPPGSVSQLLGTGSGLGSSGAHTARRYLLCVRSPSRHAFLLRKTFLCCRPRPRQQRLSADRRLGDRLRLFCHRVSLGRGLMTWQPAFVFRKRL